MEIEEIVVTVHNQEQPENGQARWRVTIWKRLASVMWYVALTVVGFLLYKAGAAYALRERGYYAIGGEALFLLLPVIYYCAAATVRDIVRDVKDRR